MERCICKGSDVLHGIALSGICDMQCFERKMKMQEGEINPKQR